MVFVALLIGFVFWRALDGSKLNNISKGLCEVIEREKKQLAIDEHEYTNKLVNLCMCLCCAVFVLSACVHE